MDALGLPLVGVFFVIMDQLQKQKLEMWEKKLQDLKKRYSAVMLRRGEAIAMGDLRENAAFQDADEEAAVVRQQITEVESIIVKLGGTPPDDKYGQDAKAS